MLGLLSHNWRSFDWVGALGVHTNQCWVVFGFLSFPGNNLYVCGVCGDVNEPDGFCVAFRNINPEGLNTDFFFGSVCKLHKINFK